MDKKYKIGEVSKLLKISIKTLRYYEDEGLIKPVEVDSFTGYRYYNQQNLEKIQKIQFLKKMNFSLKEIKNFDKNSYNEKIAELEKQIQDLKEKISIISTFKKIGGNNNMKTFINDEQVIGKWQCIGSCMSSEEFYNNESYLDNNIAFKHLYFMPNGKGYWVFDCWSKNELFSIYGYSYHYNIDSNNNLFLKVNDDYYLVYKKVDAKQYTVNEIKIKDDTNINFELDSKAVGTWKAIDFICYKDKENYTSLNKRNNANKLHLQTLEIKENGMAFAITSDNTKICKWSKGCF